jgi:hypothetical protein
MIFSSFEQELYLSIDTLAEINLEYDSLNQLHTRGEKDGDLKKRFDKINGCNIYHCG